MREETVMSGKHSAFMLLLIITVTIWGIIIEKEAAHFLRN